jgi:hypothetical protein
VLYAYRKALHWLQRAPEAETKYGSAKWFEEEEARMVERAKEGVRRRLEAKNAEDEWGY